MCLQDSTRLWEQLPADVMDYTLTLHNSVLRTNSAYHRGFELGNEGGPSVHITGALSWAMKVGLQCIALSLQQRNL
jgi:class 3 adenylate cyclase